MDRAILHDIRNELAVTIGSVYAFIDEKLPADADNLGRVLAALEEIDRLLTDLRATAQAPNAGRERLLQAIVEGSPYAKILVDDGGRIALVNGQTEALFGYRRDELLGKSIEMLVPHRYRRGHPELRTSFNAAPEARPMGAGRELFGLHRDGSEFPIEIGLNPIETDRGMFTLAAITDITERRRAEELRLESAGIAQHAAEIELLNRELADASRFKSAFVAAMSHELRTPLTAIIGSAELLALQDLPERARVHTTTIAEAADALLGIVGNVLDFSKIEAGRMDLRAAPFDLEALAEGSAEVVAPLARQKQLALHTYVDPSISGLSGDGDRLRQVLINLLGNAVKFTDRGHVVLRIIPLESAEGEMLVRFEVRDTGKGIAPEMVPRLFEPFVQVDSAEVQTLGGSGLGLSICKSLVELMNGEIGVESHFGVGSLFWFTARFAWAPGSSPRRELATQGVAALIASADEPFALIVEDYLRALGVRSHRAATQPELQRAIEDEGAQTWIAIVDDDESSAPRMPEVLGALHAAQPARVVALGGGALRKPVKRSQLFDALFRAVDAGAPAVPASTERGAPAAVTPPNGAGAPAGRIIVAEDNLQLQRLLKLQFDALAVEVHFVGDGVRAIEALAEGPCSLIFMDCQMPNMDGLSATRAIRAAEAAGGGHVPIVAMTANAFAEDREAALAAGMDDYLAKPVRLDDLRGMIARWASVPAT